MKYTTKDSHYHSVKTQILVKVEDEPELQDFLDKLRAQALTDFIDLVSIESLPNCLFVIPEVQQAMLNGIIRMWLHHFYSNSPILFIMTQKNIHMGAADFAIEIVRKTDVEGKKV